MPRWPKMVIISSTSSRLEGATSWIETTRKSRETPGASTAGKNSIVAADSILPSFVVIFGPDAASNKAIRAGESLGEWPIDLSHAHLHNLAKIGFNQRHNRQT